MGMKSMNKGEFQELLDKVYKGTVTAKERYINQRSVLKFYCSDCNTTFFAKPLWLVTHDNQKHVCNTRYGYIYGGRSESNNSGISSKKRLTEEQIKEIIELANQGKSISELARIFNVKASAVRYQFKKHGLL
jgi:Zn finger protein HypA/HybF involved in hydrogenase expression